MSCSTRLPRQLASIVLLISLASACDLSAPSASPSASTGASRNTTPTAPTSSTQPSATPQGTDEPDCATRTFASLTVEQRIGQLFVIGLTKDRLDAAERRAIRERHFGSMAFTTQTSIGAVAVHRITDAVQTLATPENTGSVRFFIAANQEGGLIQGLSGPGFDRIPSALLQGSLTAAALRQKAASWGRQLAAAGVNFNFAPVADVVPPGTDARNAPIGRLQREFGHAPETVARHVTAFIVGMRTAGIATSAKHFPGLGRVAGNTDFTSGVVDSITTRDDPFIQPFAAAIKTRVPFVMVSLATYEQIDPTHLAVFSPTVISDILRGDLRFDGVVISDAIGGTAAVSAITPGDRAIDFLLAGGDMIISNQVAPATEMALALTARVTADASFRARVDDAALRVLRAKDATGLLPCSS